LEDYYAILGLDPGASPESIKVAYRSLARQFHPDRQVNSNEQERNTRSTRMTQLNEAYATLSDPKRRREYDDYMKTLGMLKTSSVPEAKQDSKSGEKSHPSKAQPSVQTKTAAGSRVRHSHEDDSTVVREFSNQLRAQFLTKRDGPAWEEKKLEGFDWGLEATSWSSHYCVAARGFTVLDPAAAKKFANYSENVIAQGNRTIRKSHFLFLLPFQQVSEWETVSHLLQAIISGEKHGGNSRAPAGIVLVDMRQSRKLRLGGLPKEEPFHKILQSIGTGPT
jgi:curved DNA-binding protein CbpA